MRRTLVVKVAPTGTNLVIRQSKDSQAQKRMDIILRRPVAEQGERNANEVNE